jgi:Spy/CpxP family protein refolding chaperone
MKAENKHRLMVWGLVVLAIMNLSTLGTILYHTWRSEKPGINAASKQPQLEANTENFSGRFFRDKLNLDREQMDKFREFNRNYRPKAYDLTISLSKLRGNMLDEMEKANPDIAKLNELARKIGDAHTELKIITYEYYLNIKSICTPDQQVILKDLFRSIFQADARLSYPGREGKEGMGRGRMNRE